MSKLTLSEAIKHCLEVAERQEISADDKEMYSEMLGEDYKGFEEGCRECATDHRQLAEWLMELKDLRAEQNEQYVFIRELMDELKEAKSIIRVCNRVLGYLLECEIESTSTRHEVETLLKNITEYLSGGSENAE